MKEKLVIFFDTGISEQIDCEAGPVERKIYNDLIGVKFLSISINWLKILQSGVKIMEVTMEIQKCPKLNCFVSISSTRGLCMVLSRTDPNIHIGGSACYFLNAAAGDVQTTC